LKEQLTSLIHELKDQNIKVKILRCDDAVEKKYLEDECKSKGLGNMIQGKLKNRGTVCMFVGYASNHACDVYRILNLKTNHTMKSRDILWLDKSFGAKDKNVEAVNNTFDDQDEDEDENH
jgi:hypothetical protein